MITLQRTTSENPDFVALVKKLDAELAERDGQDHSFYARFNKIDNLKHVVVAYAEGVPVACGAIKAFSADAMEVKRMFVRPEMRKRGLAKKVLDTLEAWAAELKYPKCVLETGKRQPEAIALYEKSGYKVIPNYGQYTGVENSVCFEKNVR